MHGLIHIYAYISIVHAVLLWFISRQKCFSHCVHIRSELSCQITGSHSLSMGKSDQSVTSDQRYQRQKLSDQSDQKKLKTAELYANDYDAFRRQNTDSQSDVDALRLRGSQGTPALWFLLYFVGSYCTFKMSTEKLIAAVAGHPVLYDPSLFDFRDRKKKRLWRRCHAWLVGLVS